TGSAPGLPGRRPAPACSPAASRRPAARRRRSGSRPLRYGPTGRSGRPCRCSRCGRRCVPVAWAGARTRGSYRPRPGAAPRRTGRGRCCTAAHTQGAAIATWQSPGEWRPIMPGRGTLHGMDTSPVRVRVDFVSDVVCPWCAIGLASLERALERVRGEVEVDLHFQPFELNPQLGPEGDDAVEHLKHKYGMDDAQVAANQEAIRARGAELGFTFDMARRRRI